MAESTSSDTAAAHGMKQSEEPETDSENEAAVTPKKTVRGERVERTEEAESQCGGKEASRYERYFFLFFFYILLAAAEQLPESTRLPIGHTLTAVSNRRGNWEASSELDNGPFAPEWYQTRLPRSGYRNGDGLHQETGRTPLWRSS